MFYLDTSLLVAAFTHEATTDRALAWLMRRQADDLAISDWVTTEFAAALSVKLRMRQIDEEYRARAVARFAEMTASSVEILPVTAADFKVATRLASEHKHGLRAGDALHLAVASDKGATVCTLDKRLAAAGKALGMAAKLI
ncbi:MAG: type II toxin-antitoxin system VapC family toxin [Propylenella sp.]